MKVALNYKNADDGCFWMQYEDFVVIYNHLHVCKLLDDKQWKKQSFRGDWSVKKGNAGGSCNFPTWRKNDQYLLQLTEKTKVFIILTQTTKQKFRKSSKDFTQISFYVSRVDEANKRKITNPNNDASIFHPFQGRREVSSEITLDTGCPLFPSTSSSPSSPCRMLICVG